MAISGTLRYGGTTYYLRYNEDQSKTTLYLVSKIHPEDFITLVTGEDKKHRILDDAFLSMNSVPEDYVIEAVERGRKSGTIKLYKGRKILSEALDVVSLANAYKFADKYIVRNDTRKALGVLSREFFAQDDRLVFKYTKKNGFYTELYVMYEGMEISLSEAGGIKIPVRSIELTEVKLNEKKKLLVNTLNALDYESLCEVLDMSWYEKDGVRLKDYSAVTNIKEFEENVIDDMTSEYNRCNEAGEEFVLGLDTETTGFNFYDLSKENPYRDDLVAIPISWKDDQGVVIFIDMEHFTNVPIQYVFERLRSFVTGYEGKVTIKKRRVSRKRNTRNPNVENLDNLSEFSGHVNGSVVIEDDNFEWEDVEDQVIDRSLINLVGHNIMFDGRVFYSYGIKTHWNNDTLQMAFNLNPKVVKGSNKLKALTRRLFGHETPELDDILGKGNEDKYKYLTDIRVAIIYGCADTDYTRLVFKKLKAMTSTKMYKNYQKYDIRLMNQLYESEYYGMNTDSDLLERMADTVEADLEILRKFLYNLVGNHVWLKNQQNIIEKERDAGRITTEEMIVRQKAIVLKTDEMYDFDIGSGKSIRKVLYDILGYPVKSKTEKGYPSVDKFAMDRLMRIRNGPGKTNGMTQDLLSSDGKTVLIKSEEFNTFAWPIAYVLSVYAKLNKEWTSYYKPIRTQNMEGKIFKGYSLARIETRRIMNPGQTMKGALKALIKPYGPDWYLCDFDQSQVEYRIMASIAEFEEIIKKMNDPEKDYHIETASMVYNVLAHTVSKKLRKETKNVGFGVPYGLGDEKMSNNLFGAADEESLFKTRKLLYKYKVNNEPIINMLEEYRNEALKPLEGLTEEYRKFIASKPEDVHNPIGRVTGVTGFFRQFDLSDMDNKKKGKVRRPAGNFPIQNFAAELFRMILLRFHDRCVQEGIADKIIWHMTIHDELLFSVHKSVHPFFLYKLLYESCVVKFSGHTTYYIGINIGDSWADCKKDENEAPIRCVKETIDEWDNGLYRDDDYWNHSYTFVNAKGKEETYTGVKAYVFEHKQGYIKRRIGEVLKEDVQPNVDNEPVDVKLFFDKFTNYMVRSYVSDFYPMNYKPQDGDDNDAYTARLESWVLDYFGEGKEIKYPNGVVAKVYKGSSEEDQELHLDFISFEDDDDHGDDGYWNFDDVDMGESFGMTYTKFDVMDEEDEEAEFRKQFDMSIKDAKTVADFMVSSKPEYDNIRIVNNQILITVSRGSHVSRVKEKLTSKQNNEGYEVVFRKPLGIERWVKVSKDINLEDLDKLVGSL